MNYAVLKREIGIMNGSSVEELQSFYVGVLQASSFIQNVLRPFDIVIETQRKLLQLIHATPGMGIGAPCPRMEHEGCIWRTGAAICSQHQWGRGALNNPGSMNFNRVGQCP